MFLNSINNSTLQMDMTVSKEKNIPLESTQVEIIHSPMSVENNSNYMSSMFWSEESYPATIPSISDNYTKETSENMKSIIDYEKPHKNKQRKIIVISIIILLILVIIPMIITLIIILKSKNTTNKTGTSITTASFNSVSDTSIVITTPIIYDVGKGGASGDPPCISYTVINDPSRNINTSGIGGTCDTGPFFNTSIGGRWIRFMGTGGTTIPVTPPGLNHCGAFLTAWFNGSLPSIIGTIVNASVCTELYYSGTPNFCNSASVINCGSFFVYFLPPLILCNTRYCTV